MYRMSSSRGSRSPLFIARILPHCFLLALSLLGSQFSIAQPKAIGPDDLSRLRQQTEFSGDWSETDAFDLDRYITLRVTIEGVWLDLMTMTAPYDRQEARSTVFSCAAAFFPEWFDETGPKPRA